MDNMQEEDRIRVVETMSRFRRLKAFPKIKEMSHAEFFLMNAIKSLELSAQDKNKGIRVTVLAEQLKVSMPAVSRNLKTLEEKGFLQRTIDTEDRRNIFVKVTDLGNDKFIKAKAKITVFFDKVFDKLGEGKMNILLELFNQLSDIIEQEINQ